MTERYVYEGSADATILTPADFSVPLEPDQIGEYAPFELVTRQTFTSFIIRSFADSRGKLSFQTIFCQLTENHSGFQVRNTLVGLHRVAPQITDLLTPYEQRLLYSAYDGFADVPTHKVKIAQHLFPDKRVIHRKLDDGRFNTGLTAQLKTLCKFMNERQYAFQFPPDMSYREFAARRDKMTLLAK
jgi:hypothetical protein